MASTASTPKSAGIGKDFGSCAPRTPQTPRQLRFGSNESLMDDEDSQELVSKPTSGKFSMGTSSSQLDQVH